MEPQKEWTDDQLASDAITKKDLVTFLQQHSSTKFQREHKIKGKLENIAKSAKKPDLIKAYHALFETRAFYNAEEEKLEEEKAAAAKAAAAAAKTADVAQVTSTLAATTVTEKPQYTLTVIKKGDKQRFPVKGRTVSCFYTGMLEDGTVFDTNTTGRKKQPLKFEVGRGKVIRGVRIHQVFVNTGLTLA